MYIHSFKIVLNKFLFLNKKGNHYYRTELPYHITLKQYYIINLYRMHAKVKEINII